MRLLMFFGILIFFKQTTISGETTTENAKSKTLVTSDNTDSIIPGTTLLTATASKLVSYRRAPQQIKLVRKIAYSSKRPKSRHRVKRPKYKYNRPTYSYPEPLNLYTPTKFSSKYPPPLLNYEDLKDFDFNIKDFHLSSSSYEVDCDTFKGSSCYRQSKKPKVQFSHEDHTVKTVPPFHKKPERWKPHDSYGIPDGFGSPQSTSSLHESIEDSHSSGYVPNDSSYLGTYPSSEEDHSYVKEIPHQNYAFPKLPESGYTSTHSSEEAISSYEQYPPYSPESHYHVYRPYTPPPAPSQSHYESSAPHQSYSPSADSSYDPHPSDHSSYLPPSQHHSPPSPLPSEAPPIQHSYDFYDNKKEYNSNSDSLHHFAEPPSTKTDIEITYSPSYEVHPQYPPSSSKDSYQVTASQEIFPPGGHFAEPPTRTHPASSSYLPSQPYDLPLDQSANNSPYNRPKNSYEVPIYDPTPFSSTPAKQNEYLYPPHPFDVIPSFDNKKENQYQEQSHDTTNKVESISVPYHLNKAQKATKNSNKHEESNAFQEAPSSEYIDFLTTTLSTDNTRPSRRKRKRIRVTNVRKKIHNLDTPELKQAYESTNAAVDPLVDESKTVEKKQHFSSTLANPIDSRKVSRKVTTTFSNKHSWNPMKLKTTSRKLSTTTPSSLIVSKKRALQKTTPRESTLKNVSFLSIQKSVSQDFYDGTVSPDKVASQGDNSLRRTTKSVLDTTYFKTPKSDTNNTATTIGYNFTEKLHKNHKYF